jgi:uncharacterized protein YutE (UPF0331/DUF86 family)
MVDKPKLDQLLTHLRGYREALEALARVPREAFLANRDKIGNAKYHFVIAIECSIDIANHIIASERYRLPRDNADSFTVLVEEGLLASELEEPLRAMARFRNRLVHLYWDLDAERVYEYLQTSLPDFDRFAEAVVRQGW